MKDKVHEHFNERYKSGYTICNYGTKRLILEAAIRFEPYSSVLDLGSGSGRNSIYLAERNFKVTAVEYAESGIERMMEKAKEKNLQITPVLGNVTDPKILAGLGNFDNIISINLFHFLLYTQVDSLISGMQSHTNSGGYNVISAFVAMNESDKQNIIEDSLKENREHLIAYYFNQGELKERYAGWSIKPEDYEEPLTPWETHGEESYMHYIGHLIAKKPSDS